MGARRSTALGLLLVAAVAGGGSAGQQGTETGGRAAERGWMGLFLGDAVDGGVQLVGVAPGGPASRAGLRVGDVVVQAGGLRLVDVSDLTRLLGNVRPGTALQVQLLRAGRTLERVVVLAERPPSPALVPDVVRAPEAPPGSGSGCREYGLGLAEVSPDLRRHYGAPSEAGLLVTWIDPERPAAADGLRVGDVLVRLAGRPVREVPDVERALWGPAEAAIRASLIREGRRTDLTLRGAGGLAGARASAPLATAVARRTAALAADRESAQARAALQDAVRLEIERLRRRIEELKRMLESQEGEDPPDR